MEPPINNNKLNSLNDLLQISWSLPESTLKVYESESETLVQLQNLEESTPNLNGLIKSCEASQLCPGEKPEDRSQNVGERTPNPNELIKSYEASQLCSGEKPEDRSQNVAERTPNLNELIKSCEASQLCPGEKPEDRPQSVAEGIPSFCELVPKKLIQSSEASHLCPEEKPEDQPQNVAKETLFGSSNIKKQRKRRVKKSQQNSSPMVLNVDGKCINNYSSDSDNDLNDPTWPKSGRWPQSLGKKGIKQPKKKQRQFTSLSEPIEIPYKLRERVPPVVSDSLLQVVLHESDFSGKNEQKLRIHNKRQTGPKFNKPEILKTQFKTKNQEALIRIKHLFFEVETTLNQVESVLTDWKYSKKAPSKKEVKGILKKLFKVSCSLNDEYLNFKNVANELYIIENILDFLRKTEDLRFRLELSIKKMTYESNSSTIASDTSIKKPKLIFKNLEKEQSNEAIRGNMTESRYETTSPNKSKSEESNDEVLKNGNGLIPNNVVFSGTTQPTSNEIQNIIDRLHEDLTMEEPPLNGSGKADLIPEIKNNLPAEQPSMQSVCYEKSMTATTVENESVNESPQYLNKEIHFTPEAEQKVKDPNCNMQVVKKQFSSKLTKAEPKKPLFPANVKKYKKVPVLSNSKNNCQNENPDILNKEKLPSIIEKPIANIHETVVERVKDNPASSLATTGMPTVSDGVVKLPNEDITTNSVSSLSKKPTSIRAQPHQKTSCQENSNTQAIQKMFKPQGNKQIINVLSKNTESVNMNKNKVNKCESSSQAGSKLIAPQSLLSYPAVMINGILYQNTSHLVIQSQTGQPKMPIPGNNEVNKSQIKTFNQKVNSINRKQNKGTKLGDVPSDKFCSVKKPSPIAEVTSYKKSDSEVLPHEKRPNGVNAKHVNSTHRTLDKAQGNEDVIDLTPLSAEDITKELDIINICKSLEDSSMAYHESSDKCVSLHDLSTPEVSIANGEPTMSVAPLSHHENISVQNNSVIGMETQSVLCEFGNIAFSESQANEPTKITEHIDKSNISNVGSMDKSVLQDASLTKGFIDQLENSIFSESMDINMNESFSNEFRVPQGIHGLKNTTRATNSFRCEMAKGTGCEEFGNQRGNLSTEQTSLKANNPKIQRPKVFLKDIKYVRVKSEKELVKVDDLSELFTRDIFTW